MRRRNAIRVLGVMVGTLPPWEDVPLDEDQERLEGEIDEELENERKRYAVEAAFQMCEELDIPFDDGGFRGIDLGLAL